MVTTTISPQDMEHDRQILRDLARQLRELADDPVNEERKRLSKRTNALDPERPLVLCSPEGSWVEVIPPDSAQCVDPLHQRWERTLRQRIWHGGTLRDDCIVEPFFNIGWQLETGDYGVEIPRTQGDNRGSFVWDPPIKDLDADFDKLKQRSLAVDRDTTQQQFEHAKELLGDILDVRIHHQPWWSMGLTQTAVYLIGIEQMMYAMFDNPDAVHRLMAFLRDDQMRYVKWMESEGLLGANASGDFIGSGGVGVCDDLATDPYELGVPLSQRWGFGESQETVGISPSMFDEFILPYQVPLLDLFGYNYYGCCEELESRVGLVLEKAPRIRRLSLSPKCNQRKITEAADGNCVLCRKADPVPVCVGFNEKGIRRDVRHTLDVAGDQPLEIILKDTHTVQNEPWRLARWVEIVREEIDNYST